VTIYGVDLSHYDNPNVRRALDEGFSFMTHKAGGDQLDPELAAWWGNVRTLPEDRMLLGAYWVLYPGNPAGRADAFLTRLDSQCPGWRDRDAFILQADCEKWGGDPSTMPGRSDIQTFCDRLHTRTGLVPVVYAPRWAYGDTLTGLDYPLWASSYVAGSGAASSLYPGDTSSRWAAYSGQTPVILQFTSSATIAGQTTCDANAHRGTLTDLKALVTGVSMNWTDDIIPNPSWRGDAKTNPTVTATFALSDMWTQAHAASAGVAALAKQVTALTNSLLTAIQAVAAKDFVDEHALAEAMIPGVVAGVAAQLQAAADSVSQDEVTTAVIQAFRAGFGTPPA
jgi:GH25 family lysozyme M1 (1,4-beta-N-acetylmuramidase)